MDDLERRLEERKKESRTDLTVRYPQLRLAGFIFLGVLALACIVGAMWWAGNAIKPP
jgi:hypothetical protein